jgi:hypothetical protein
VLSVTFGGRGALIVNEPDTPAPHAYVPAYFARLRLLRSRDFATSITGRAQDRRRRLVPNFV